MHCRTGLIYLEFGIVARFNSLVFEGWKNEKFCFGFCVIGCRVVVVVGVWSTSRTTGPANGGRGRVVPFNERPVGTSRRWPWPKALAGPAERLPIGQPEPLGSREAWKRWILCGCQHPPSVTKNVRSGAGDDAPRFSQQVLQMSADIIIWVCCVLVLGGMLCLCDEGG